MPRTIRHQADAPRPSLRALLIASTALVAVGCIAPAHANNWIAINGGSWSVGANWDAGVPPGGGDDAVITDPGTSGGIVFVDINATTDNVYITNNNTVEVGNTNSLSTGYTIGIDTGGQLIVQAGGTVNASDIIENHASGTLTSAGTVSTGNGYTNDGATNASGVFNGAIVNQELGVFTVTGGLTGNSTFSNIDGGSLQVTGGDYTGLTTVTNTTSGIGGGIQVAATHTLGATTIDNNAGGRIISQGTIAAALNNNNNGVIIASGAVNGAVTNNDTATFTVNGNLTGNGTFSNTGTARLLVQAGDYTGLDTVTNTSTHAAGGIQVFANRTLSATNVQNNAGGTIVNFGTLTSTNAIVNAGTLTTNTATSIVNGGLTNTGTVSAAGQVNGTIQNNGSATFTVTGNLTGNSSFTNSDTAQLLVTGGNFTGITTLANSSANAVGVDIAATRTLSALFVDNNAGATIVNAGTLALTLGILNAGTLTTNTANSIVNAGLGGLNNTGTVSAAGQINGTIQNNGSATFTVAGALTGDGIFFNFGTAQLLVTGGSFTGITTLANSSSDPFGVQVGPGFTLSAETFTNAAGSTVRNVGGTVTTTVGGYTNDGTTLASGAFNGAITNQGSGLFQVNGNLTVNGAITNQGSGLFQVNGALTGNNSFTNSGDAQLVVGGTFTGLTGLANTSTNANGVQVNSGNLLAVAGTFTNAAGSFVVSSGIVNTTGGYTNDGVTTASNAFNGAIANQGNGIFELSGSLAGNGTFTNSGTAQLLVNGGDFTGLTAITNTSSHVDGGIQVAATRTLSATTTIDNNGSGTIVANGTIVATSLNINGGTVSGTGTLPTTVVNSGGTLSPGNSIGVINVQGNLTFNAGSTYAVEVSPNDADRTEVSGTAALNGTVAATFLPGSYLARSYTILTAGSRTGMFASLTTSNLPAGFTASLNYTTTDAELVLTAVLGQGGTLPPGGLPGNQQGLANALNDYFNNGGTLPPGFVTLFGLTGTALVNGLAQVGGPAPSGAPQSATQIMNGFLTTVLNPFGGAPGSNPGAIGYARAVGADRSPLPKEAADAFAAIMPRQLDGASFDRRWNVWGQGFGGYNKTDGSVTAGTADTSTRAYGFAAGADYRVTRDTTLGFALSGGETRWSLAQGLGGGRSDVFQAGAYGSHSFGAAYVSGSLAYAWYDTTTDRSVTVAGLDMLRANFDAHSFGGRLEAGYRVATPVVGVTPYVAGQVQRFRTPGYTEAAVFGSNQFALSYGSRSTTATRFELGTWLDKLVMLNRGDAIMLRGRVAWAHDDNGSGGLNAVFQTLPGANFTVNGAEAPRNLALLSAGGEYRFAGGLSLGGRFDGEFASRGQTYAGTGTVRYAW